MIAIIVTTMEAIIVGTISVSTIPIATVLGSISFIYQVDITEIPVTIAATIAVVVIARVTGARGTILFIAVSIAAEHKGFVIFIVESIIAALARVFSLVGVGLGRAVFRFSCSCSTAVGYKSQSNHNLQHVGGVCCCVLFSASNLQVMLSRTGPGFICMAPSLKKLM
jgi:hypothetical protein